jgi:hypothetical protein
MALNENAELQAALDSLGVATDAALQLVTDDGGLAADEKERLRDVLLPHATSQPTVTPEQVARIKEVVLHSRFRALSAKDLTALAAFVADWERRGEARDLLADYRVSHQTAARIGYFELEDCGCELCERADSLLRAATLHPALTGPESQGVREP